MQLSVSSEGGFLQICAHSPDGAMPDKMDDLLVQALQFVTAAPVWWRVLQTNYPVGERYSLRGPNQFQGKARLQPPVRPLHIRGKAKDYWDLFRCYLAFVQPWSDPRWHWHPLSRCVRRVIEDSAASLSSYATGLSIAVERILSLLYPEMGTPPESIREQIRSLAKHVRCWAGDDTLKERACGAIGAMSTPRAKDRLRELLNEGTVSQREVDAWAELRNPAAHGELEDRADIEQILTNVNRVIMLMYRLIFRAIGYVRLYTDYGSPGWPVRSLTGADEAASDGTHGQKDLETRGPEETGEGNLSSG